MISCSRKFKSLVSAAKNVNQKPVMANQTVASLMNEAVITTTPMQTLSSLVNDIMLAQRVSFVPVVEKGCLLGYADLDTAVRIDRENWPVTRINDIFVACDDSNTVEPDMAAKDLLTRMTRLKRCKFLVADGTRLLGVIFLSDMIGFLALLLQSEAAS